MIEGYTVRVNRPYRYSPNGVDLRVVRPQEELGVPEEVPYKIAALMIDVGIATKIDPEEDQPTAAEILDKAASAKGRKKTK